MNEFSYVLGGATAVIQTRFRVRTSQTSSIFKTTNSSISQKKYYYHLLFYYTVFDILIYIYIIIIMVIIVNWPKATAYVRKITSCEKMQDYRR